MNTTWGNTVQLGVVSTTGMTSPTFNLTGPGVVANAVSGWDIIGNTLAPNQAVSGITGDTIITPGATLMHIDITASGAVSLTFGSAMGVLPAIQSPGFFQNFSITATDSTGTTAATTPSFSFQFQPNYIGTAPTVLVGDQITLSSFDTMNAQGGNFIVLGKGGDDTVYAGNGNSLILGGAGNDTFFFLGAGTTKMFGEAGNDTFVMQDPSFLKDGVSLVDGGSGSNVLQLGSYTVAQTYNLEGSTNVTNIQDLQIVGIYGGSATSNTTIRLDFQDVFDMSPSHTLTIHNSAGPSFGSAVIIDTNGQLTGPAAVSTAGTVETITGTMVSNGQTVTLIIDKGAGLPTDGVTVTLN
jgi:hypothetical protein